VGSSAEASVFVGGTSSNILRQWAELSQWFPSITPAIGNLPASGVLGNVTDVNLSPYGTLGFVKTHSYLYESPVTQVWQAFPAIHAAMAP